MGTTFFQLSKLSFNFDHPIEVYVYYSPESGESHPQWLLSVQSVGSKGCRWIHSTGGPTQERDYECRIQAKKSIDSHDIASISLQGTISSQDVDKVIAVAKRIEPQQCQMYGVAVVAELEKDGLLPQGRTAFIKD